MSDTTSYDVTDPQDMGRLKSGSDDVNATKSWRADLWGNVPQAINWANEIPISQPGEIVFNIRDNGQVWTYTFGVWG